MLLTFGMSAECDSRQVSGPLVGVCEYSWVVFELCPVITPVNHYLQVVMSEPVCTAARWTKQDLHHTSVDGPNCFILKIQFPQIVVSYFTFHFVAA